MSTSPTQTCQLCGLVEVVRMDGRGFPPDIAKRRLKKRCAAVGCTSDPRYLVGLSFGESIRGMSSAATRPDPTTTAETNDREADR